MGFSKHALFAVIALSACLYSADAFAFAPSLSLQTEARRVGSCGPNIESRPRPLSVTLSSVDDLVGAADDEDDEAGEPDEVIVSIDDLGTTEIRTEDTSEPSAPWLHEQALGEMREKFQRHDTDTGSPEFQVAGMTERISYLTKHLKTHPKDFSTRRGLVALVNKRRRLLNYLFTEDVNRYQELVQGLGIRHKAPGRVQSREEKYGQFPSQKNPKKHRKSG